MKVKSGKAISDKVWRRIEAKGPGTTWNYVDFQDLPFSAVAKALSRLVKSGRIIRMQKGIYHYPKNTALGRTRPMPEEIIKKISKTRGIRLHPNAATAAYNLRITTQMPATLTIASRDPQKHKLFDSVRIKSIRRMSANINASTIELINILEVMRDIKKIPGISPKEAALGVKNHITKMKKSRVRELLRMSMKEPARVRALVGAILTDMNVLALEVKELKATLNPLTKYKLDIGETIHSASSWGIK